VSRLSYLDASALVKLAVTEAESPAMLRWYVEAERVATSRVGIVETTRAAARYPHDAQHLRLILNAVEVIELEHGVGERAAEARPVTLRVLDAIHLASALALMPEIDAFVTYDDRLADAARAAGLPVVRPA
jgi:hypothetical protein